MEELGFNESLEAPIRLHGGNESADPRYKIAIRFFLGLTSCSHPPRLVNIRHALHPNTASGPGQTRYSTRSHFLEDSFYCTFPSSLVSSVMVK